MSESTVGIGLRNAQDTFSLHKFVNTEVKNIISASRNIVMRTRSNPLKINGEHQKYSRHGDRDPPVIQLAGVTRHCR